jgi:HEAT repeat protein
LREEEEKKEIDSLLTANRGISADDEYLNLFIEILFLEDRADQYPLLVEQISQYRRQLLARRDFERAARLLLVLRELSESPEALQSGKASAFCEAVGEAAGPAALAELEEALRPAGAEGDGSLLHYLQLLGPPAARLIGGLYEMARTPAAREAALEALKRVGAENLEALISMVQESKPGLARQVVALVSGNQDKRVVPFLAGFLSYKDPSVRLEAVRALGRAQGAAAARVLLGFVADEAESVRIAALESLGCADRATVSQLLIHVGGAAVLRQRSLAEKRAFMSALGRSRSGEACAWLRQVLGKAPLFSGPKHTELCLCAVEALVCLAPLPEALEALRLGAKKRQRKVREACLAALSRLPREKTLRA